MYEIEKILDGGGVLLRSANAAIFISVNLINHIGLIWKNQFYWINS